MLGRLVVPALLVSGLLAACGTSYGASGAAASSARKAVVLKLRQTPLGKVLVDSRGFVLYLYTPDPTRKSVCYGSCASAWPPLLTSASPRAGRGVKPRLLGTTKRKDGKLQVTYAGHPLYLYTGDAKAGQTNGQGFGGIWYMLSASGKGIRRGASSHSSTTPGTTTSRPVYGGGY